MPVQNELRGILIEDFLSIWKLRAVFISGMMTIFFGMIRDFGVLEEVGDDSYISGIMDSYFTGR
jgi:hypothetical protein